MLDKGFTTITYNKTSESAKMFANVKRAVALTSKINQLTLDNIEEI